MTSDILKIIIEAAKKASYTNEDQIHWINSLTFIAELEKEIEKLNNDESVGEVINL